MSVHPFIIIVYGKRNKDSVYTRIIYYCINNIIAYQLLQLVKGVVHCIVYLSTVFWSMYDKNKLASPHAPCIILEETYICIRYIPNRGAHILKSQ